MVQPKNKKNARYTFSLKLLKRGKRMAPLAPADSGESWSLFALTSAGIKQFRRLQHDIQKIKKSKSNVSIRVRAKPAKTAPKPPPSLPLTLMLKFKSKEDFITLLDGSIPTDRTTY